MRGEGLAFQSDLQRTTRVGLKDSKAAGCISPLRGHFKDMVATPQLIKGVVIAFALLSSWGESLLSEAVPRRNNSRIFKSSIVEKLYLAQRALLDNSNSSTSQFPLSNDDLFGSFYSLNSLYVDLSHKLVVCPIQKAASSLFTKLFRRMDGKPFWYEDHWDRPQGLITARKLGIKKMEEIMLDKSWTKAIFFRHPVDRLISSYRQFMTSPYASNHYVFKMRGRNASISWEEFLDRVLQGEGNIHWNPQTHYCSYYKFWKQFTFVGDFDSLYDHGRMLLERVGAWEQYGKRGWGLSGVKQMPGRHYWFEKRGQSRVLHRNLTALQQDLPPSFNVSDCIFCENYASHRNNGSKGYAESICREDWERIMNSTFYSLDVIQLQLSLSEGPGPMVSDDLEAFTSYKAWVNNKRKKKRKKEPLRVYYSL